MTWRTSQGEELKQAAAALFKSISLYWLIASKLHQENAKNSSGIDRIVEVECGPKS
jgi:hypothetical protein